jgi:hypothetical protein
LRESGTEVEWGEEMTELNRFDRDMDGEMSCEEYGEWVRADDAFDRIKELEKQKDSAYTERNKLVAALSKLYPASLGKHDENDLSWDRDWLSIVFIRTPHGQLSWHLHDSDMPLFAHLELGTEVWDGHTTDEKYERLSKASFEDMRI